MPEQFTEVPVPSPRPLSNGPLSPLLDADEAIGPLSRLVRVVPDDGDRVLALVVERWSTAEGPRGALPLAADPERPGTGLAVYAVDLQTGTVLIPDPGLEARYADAAARAAETAAVGSPADRHPGPMPGVPRD